MVKLNQQEIDKELEDLNTQLEEEQKDPTIKSFPEKEEEEEPKEEEKEEAPEEKESEEVIEEEEPTEEEGPDYKKKFSESSREAQKILAQKRKLNQAIVDSTGIAEPTDEEMTQEFENWDIMSDFERKVAKDNAVNKKWRENISKAQLEVDKIDKWTEKVGDFVEDPKTFLDNPDLEGKQEDFRAFASTEENSSVPFKILVGAFLHENQSKQVKHKGQMFPTGQGGDKEKPRREDGKITFEEGEKLKGSNYTKWKELLKTDKIADPEL